MAIRGLSRRRLPLAISRGGFLGLNLPNHSVKGLRPREQKAWRKLVVAVFVKPGAFDVEESQARHEARQRECVNGELRDRLVGARIGLVVEDVDRAVARLQEIDMSSDEARFVAAGGIRWMNRLFRNDRHAVHFFKRRYIVFDESDRDFNRKGNAVVGQHEALQFGMAVVVCANARNDQRGGVGRDVLFFEDGQAVEGKESGRELRTARAVLAAKQIVGARVRCTVQKIGKRSEASVAGAAIVQGAVAQEGEFCAVETEFIHLLVIELDSSDDLRRLNSLRPLARKRR